MKVREGRQEGKNKLHKQTTTRGENKTHTAHSKEVGPTFVRLCLLKIIIPSNWPCLPKTFWRASNFITDCGLTLDLLKQRREKKICQSLTNFTPQFIHKSYQVFWGMLKFRLISQTTVFCGSFCMWVDIYTYLGLIWFESIYAGSRFSFLRPPSYFIHLNL